MKTTLCMTGLLALFTASVFAGIGETKEDVIKRYGDLLGGCPISDPFLIAPSTAFGRHSRPGRFYKRRPGRLPQGGTVLLGHVLPK